MIQWRLIDSGFQSGAFNMALDEALFRTALDEPEAMPMPTLRIYGFRRPTITYGYSQKIPEHWARDPFYETAKRITGGGIVFHGKDLTYSLICPIKLLGTERSVSASYHVFHEVAKTAFKKMGIDADFCEKSSDDEDLRSLCFLSPVKNDLLFDGKKIAGGAQKRSKGILLHQGSVNFRAFIKKPSDYKPLFEKFKKAFLASFKEAFGAEFVIQSLQASDCVEEFHREYYAEGRAKIELPL